MQGHVANCLYATWYLFRIKEEITKIRQQITEKSMLRPTPW